MNNAKAKRSNKLTITAALAAALMTTAAGAALRLPPTKTLGATVLDANEQNRTITVLFDRDHTEATYPVAEDAKFFTFDGKLRWPTPLGALPHGTHVVLEFGELPGSVSVSMVAPRNEGRD